MISVEWLQRTLVLGLVLLAAPGNAIETSWNGHRIDLDVTLEVRGVIETDRSTTGERPLEQLRLRAGVSLTDWLRFDSSTVGSNGGPTRVSNSSGVYHWDETFQNLSPAVDFEEAYFDVFLPAVDIRLGKQKIAWGKLDGTQPNDLLNPLSYVDPFMLEKEERKIGVPAAQISYYLPTDLFLPQQSRLTAVWVPRYLPFRFPNAGCSVNNGASRCEVERWFPPAAVPPPTFRVPEGVLPLPDGMVNPAFDVPLAFATSNRGLPAWRFENSEVGVRYSALTHDVDFALYYFHGFDNQPAFRLTAEALGPVDNPTGATLLQPVFRQIDSWGADFAYTLRDIALRGEWAFVHGRPFSRDLRRLVMQPRELSESLRKAFSELVAGAERAPVDLPESFVVRDAMEWGLGADTVYEGTQLLLQLSQTDVLHNDVDLLIEDVETRLLARAQRGFLADTLFARVDAIYGFEADYTFVRPKLIYHYNDVVSFEAGYLLLAGRAFSVLGQYKDNDQVYVLVQARL